jgi:hypothetical protein
VHISAVNEQKLTGYVRSLLRKQIDYHGCHFLFGGHAVSQGYVSGDTLQFRLGLAEPGKPLMI